MSVDVPPVEEVLAELRGYNTELLEQNAELLAALRYLVDEAMPSPGIEGAARTLGAIRKARAAIASATQGSAI